MQLDVQKGAGAMRRQLGLWTFAITLGASAAACAAPSLPRGWREATAAERAELLQESRKAGGPTHQKLAVEADFDGDGRTDRAAILLNDARRVFAPFVARAATGRYEQLDEGDRITSLWNYTLEVEPPGTHETACARGHGDDRSPCRKQVRNRWPALGFAVMESSYQIYFWDGRRFDNELLTD